MTGLSVPCLEVAHVSAEFPARHLCPFYEEADEGSVTIEWVTSHGETFELHALAKLADSRSAEKVSHEQWTADLSARLASGARVAGLAVTSTWSTAGATVTVQALPVEGGGPTQ